MFSKNSIIYILMLSSILVSPAISAAKGISAEGPVKDLLILTPPDPDIIASKTEPHLSDKLYERNEALPWDLILGIASFAIASWMNEKRPPDKKCEMQWPMQKRENNFFQMTGSAPLRPNLPQR